MKFTILPLVLAPLASAYIGGHCAGSNHPRSICLKTTTCDQYHGSRFVGGCPDDPNDVECCTINGCDGVNSFCDWTGPNSDCAGIPYAVFVTGQFSFHI